MRAVLVRIRCFFLLHRFFLLRCHLRRRLYPPVDQVGRTVLVLPPARVGNSSLRLDLVCASPPHRTLWRPPRRYRTSLTIIGRLGSGREFPPPNYVIIVCLCDEATREGFVSEHSEREKKSAQRDEREKEKEKEKERGHLLDKEMYLKLFFFDFFFSPPPRPLSDAPIDRGALFFGLCFRRLCRRGRSTSSCRRRRRRSLGNVSSVVEW